MQTNNTNTQTNITASLVNEAALCVQCYLSNTSCRTQTDCVNSLNYTTKFETMETSYE